MIIMDVLPYGYKEIEAFSIPVRPEKPWRGFRKDGGHLGETWWRNSGGPRNGMRHVHVLNQAARNLVPPKPSSLKSSTRPTSSRRPSSI